MDTRQVVARFEAERQALAMMDHPNIARVLDGGATGSGRPYFVMELVRGDPVTDYCDRNSLGTDDRLDIFRQVCHAVQHAHQKGVIHRDLKPGNVLVTVADGRPLPKVIDFGIAKATDRRLTEKTLFTEHRQLIGTPAYMSPEQAEMSGVDIDTRSDIYSLGVLLYELLTGTTPFDAGDLASAAFDDIRRIIREQEPERPSTRLSSMLAGRTPPLRRHERLEHPGHRAAPPDGPCLAGAHRARRPGLDRDEVPGQGPHAPIRDGQRPRPRHRALPEARAGVGGSAGGDIPTAQVRSAQPRPGRRRGGDLGAAPRRHRRHQLRHGVG
ncbi:MAG: serine/threonine-protein kinase, partial [Planctomycetota bacterium]